MKWIVGLSACVVAALGVVSSSHVFAQEAAPAAPAGGTAPVMDTHRLMSVFADPVMDEIKEASKEAPATPKGWRVLQDKGMAVAEIAVLTMMREGEHEATPEWDQLSEVMKKAGIALSDAAAKKDFPGVQAQVTAIIASCNTCHKKYEPETAPEILP